MRPVCPFGQGLRRPALSARIFRDRPGLGLPVKAVFERIHHFQAFLNSACRLDRREIAKFLGQRFNDIKKILSTKYKPVRLKKPEVPLLFKANIDYVYLFLPWDKDIVAEYMTGAAYRQEQLAARQTVEDKKTLERREQKRLERERAEEAAEF